MRKEVGRFTTTINGKKEVGVLDNENNFFTIRDLVSHLSINVYESMLEIQSGKKADETNVRIEMKALDSLSNALNALANDRNH